MKGIRFLRECSFHVYESETDENGTMETFNEGQLSDASIIDTRIDGTTYDLQFGDGSVAFGIPQSFIKTIDIPLTK
jgi:hypothetical protein